jgi:hypothetical protein
MYVSLGAILVSSLYCILGHALDVHIIMYVSLGAIIVSSLYCILGHALDVCIF